MSMLLTAKLFGCVTYLARHVPARSWHSVLGQQLEHIHSEIIAQGSVVSIYPLLKFYKIIHHCRTL